MSYRWQRSLKISNGRFMEAMAWSMEAIGYIEKKHNTPKIHTWVDAFGHLGTMRWTMDAPDLATIEKVQTSINMDHDYWKIVAKAAAGELFVDGSGFDAISKSVS